MKKCKYSMPITLTVDSDNYLDLEDICKILNSKDGFVIRHWLSTNSTSEGVLNISININKDDK